MIETTYDVVVLAEALMYASIALLALALAFFWVAAGWHKAAEAHGQLIWNRFEWEQRRQQMLLTDEKGDHGVHEDTAEFFQLDDR